MNSCNVSSLSSCRASSSCDRNEGWTEVVGHIWLGHWYLTNYGGFLKWWYPQTIHFSRVFHYKPSILGYPYFWKHPYIFVKFLATHACESKVTRFLAACTWSKHDISRVRVAISNKDSQEAYTSFSLKIQIPKSQCILSTQKDVQQTSFLPSSLSSMAPWSLQRWPGCLQQNLCTEQKKQGTNARLSHFSGKKKFLIVKNVQLRFWRNCTPTSTI